MMLEVLQGQTRYSLCFDPVRAAPTPVIDTIRDVHKANTLACLAGIWRRKRDEFVVVEKVVRKLNQSFISTPVVPAQVRFLEYRNNGDAIVEERLQWSLSLAVVFILVFIFWGECRFEE